MKHDFVSLSAHHCTVFTLNRLFGRNLVGMHKTILQTEFIMIEVQLVRDQLVGMFIEPVAAVQTVHFIFNTGCWCAACLLRCLGLVSFILLRLGIDHWTQDKSNFPVRI